jgi:hypothetical protein
MTIPFEEIAQEVASQGASWEVGETSLTNLLQEERELRLGYTPGQESRHLSSAKVWRKPTFRLARSGNRLRLCTSGKLRLAQCGGQATTFTPVKDQGSCGSCIAFGSVATVETTLRVARKNPGLSIDLSEAHLFYCIARAQGRMCSSVPMGAGGGPTCP